MSSDPTFPMTFRRTAVIVSLALFGCGGASGGRTDARGPIVVDGDAVHVVATPESIAAVEDLAVLEDGTVWVLNSVEPLFLGYDPEGGPLGPHGRVGGGPGEFGDPSAFVAGGWDDEAWVFDRRRHALIRVSSPGYPRAEIPLPRGEIPPGSVLGGLGLLTTEVRTARLGDAIVLPRRIGTGELPATSFWTTMWDAQLVALDPETGEVRTVVSLPEAMGDLTARFEELGIGTPPFPLWTRLWAVCGEDQIRLYDFVRDRLLGFGPDRAELAAVPVPVPFTGVSPRQFALAAFDIAAAEQAGAVRPGVGHMSAADSARILDRIVPRIDGTPDRLAGLLPKYVDFRCADDGSMWLRPLDLVRGGLEGGPTWVRILPDGEAREVRFPERFDPYRFTSGRIWGVLRDELGVASIAWVEAPAD